MELPSAFINRTRDLLGASAYEEFADALRQEQPVSIRFNRKKFVPAEAYSPVPWATDACYLDKRLTFTFDPLFHAGGYYVQEAGSMFLEQAVRRYAPQEPLVALDLCAAPGGKSTHLRSLLPEGSLLLANEVMRNRVQVLAENLTKWGHPDVIVTNNDPADFAPLQHLFDFILTDVPCSGEGMFRKDPVAVSEWSEANVELCRQRQRRILSDVWGCLKPGGLLVYSTCTYNTCENEENVRWICRELGAEVLPLDVPEEWGVTGNLLSGSDFPVYRFLPHKTNAEGFFLAVLRKHPGEAEPYSGRAESKKRKESRKQQPKGKNAPLISKAQLASVREWIAEPDRYELLAGDTTVTAFPKEYLDLLSACRSCLNVVQAGIPLAELKGRDLLPSHALAMSVALMPEAFPRQELDYGQAIAYLRKEAVALPAEAPRGMVLLTYRQLPLGFAKNVGNRANNLYPQEWRIRSGYLPEELRLL